VESEPNVRLIAFYLPQFHPIPENDERWGKGFTEWRRVVQARPLFPGHYQPHLPADLGFYDLRVAEVREAQAAMARAYGIHGFCYYHYWFNGKRKLQRPFEEVLAAGKPDLPFCLCWANDNWTRVWDGKSHEILEEQHYGDDDDRAHIRALIPAFRDPRYIRIDGKPLFLIYRSENFPDPRRSRHIWCEEMRRAGLGELYLARVESFIGGVDPRESGFDGAVEFAPDWRNMGRLKLFHGWESLSKLGLLPRAYTTLHVCDYEFMMRRMLEKPWPEYDFFRGVTPGFDNTARRGETAAVFVNSSPAKYQEWLARAVADTKSRYQGDHRLVFVNAWNEWGEGNHLEPDLKYGHAFLDATVNALAGIGSLPESGNGDAPFDPPRWKEAYWQGRHFLKAAGGALRSALGRN
jgi:lipopolysaccharide biosynthesis protein